VRRGDAPFGAFEIAADGRCFAQVCENARNGLHVNGREVTTRRLIHGDQIYAGGEEFVFAEASS